MAPYINVPVETGEPIGEAAGGRTARLSWPRVAGCVTLISLVAVGLNAALKSPHHHKPLRGSLSAEVSDILITNKACAKLWGQCGGDGFTGSTCCEVGSTCHHKPLKKLPSYHQCLKSSSISDSGGCAKLWGQCGGDDFAGPTCCEAGSVCEDKALPNVPSYRQCRKKAPPAPKCGEPEPGSTCAMQLDQDKGAAYSNSAAFHGITPQMDKKEFQLFEHLWNFDASQCPEPCAPSTCFFALHLEGCDTMDTWYCSEDDGSAKYACCCNYFNDEKALDPPENPDPDMANAMKAVGSETPKFFCTAMCMPVGYELPLLRSQYEKKVGLFDCNEWAVYSNETLRLSSEGSKPVAETMLINGSLSAEMGGHWGTALNTDVFVRFWDRVIANPKTWECDWIVKVDPDTMWMPVRLRALLRTTHGPLGQPEPDKGRYLNNCHVGLHGPIEVLTKTALATYSKDKEQCRHDDKVSKIGQEDFFLDMCFQLLGIEQVKTYNLMLEATLACQEVASALDPDRPPCFSPQVAFHPFKNTETWMRCHKEAANHPWALPVVPVTDGPSEANDRHG